MDHESEAARQQRSNSCAKLIIAGLWGLGFGNDVVTRGVNPSGRPGQFEIAKIVSKEDDPAQRVILDMQTAGAVRVKRVRSRGS